MTDVLGYLVQCEVCPQQALVAEYTEGWLCPRCAEVAEPADLPPYQAPEVFQGSRAAVELADGTLWTGAGNGDARAYLQSTIDLVETALSFARSLLGPLPTEDDDYPVSEVQG